MFSSMWNLVLLSNGDSDYGKTKKNLGQVLPPFGDHCLADPNKSPKTEDACSLAFLAAVQADVSKYDGNFKLDSVRNQTGVRDFFRQMEIQKVNDFGAGSAVVRGCLDRFLMVFGQFRFQQH